MPNVLTFYSNITFFMNLFRINRQVNSALYLSNFLSFVGNFMFMLKTPEHLKYLVQTIPYLNRLSLGVLHVMNQIYHILPLYLFRHRQTLQEVVSFSSFRIAILLFLAYVILMPTNVIIENYSVSKPLFVVGFFTLMLFIWLCTLTLKKK
jgi:hypothetical protein